MKDPNLQHKTHTKTPNIFRSIQTKTLISYLPSRLPVPRVIIPTIQNTQKNITKKNK